MSELTFLDVLRKSGVSYKSATEVLTGTAGGFTGSHPNLFITDAGQLVGPHSAFRAFRADNPAYKGWEAHHIVENRALKALDVADRFTPYRENLCVLIPGSGAHRWRINSYLREAMENGEAPAPEGLLEEYSVAYELLGDYVGGGEEAIVRELMLMVLATLMGAGLCVAGPQLLGRYRELLAKVRSELELDGREHPGDLFQKSLAYRPLVGGFLLGAPDAESALVCEDAQLVPAEGMVALDLQVREGGILRRCSYSTPISEMWAAYQIIRPSRWMTILTGVAGGECHLVDGAPGDFPNPDKYTLHPALATSPVGHHLVEAERESLIYFLRRHERHSPSVIQWYDVPARFRLQGDRLEVQSSDPEAGSPIRLRGYKVESIDRGGSETIGSLAALFAARSGGDPGYLDIQGAVEGLDPGAEKLTAFEYDQDLELSRMRRRCSGFDALESFVRTLAVMRWVCRCLGRDRFPAWPGRLRAETCAVETEFGANVSLCLDDVNVEPLAASDRLDDHDVFVVGREMEIERTWGRLAPIRLLFGYEGFRSRSRLGPASERVFALSHDGQRVGHLQMIDQPVVPPRRVVRCIQAQLFFVSHYFGQSRWQLFTTNAAYDRDERLVWYRMRYRCPDEESDLIATAVVSKGRLCVEYAGSGEKDHRIHDWHPDAIILDPSLVGIPGRVRRQFAEGRTFTVPSITITGPEADRLKILEASPVPDRRDSQQYELDIDGEPTLVTWGPQGFATRVGPFDLEPDLRGILHQSVHLASMEGHSTRSLVSLDWLAGEGDRLELSLRFRSPEARAAFRPPSGVSSRESDDAVLLGVPAPTRHLGPGRQPLPAAEPSDDELREMLRPTERVDYLHPLVETYISSRVVRGGIRLNPLGVMSDRVVLAAALEFEVFSEVQGSYLDRAVRASEVARVGKGACLEQAILLAALLRSRNVPARVVGGVAFAEGDRFGAAHAWVEAWIDGNWFAYDAALFGQAMTRVKLKGIDPGADGDDSVYEGMERIAIRRVPARAAADHGRSPRDLFMDDPVPVQSPLPAPMRCVVRGHDSVCALAYGVIHGHFASLQRLKCDHGPRATRPSPEDRRDLARISMGSAPLDLFNLILHERVLHRDDPAGGPIPAELWGDAGSLAGYRLGAQVGLLGYATCLSKALDAMTLDAIREHIFDTQFFARLAANLRLAGLQPEDVGVVRLSGGLVKRNLRAILRLHRRLVQALLPKD